MYINLAEIVKNFNTTPFLFVGSGLTRRYYNLPDWKSLLEIFSKKISNDDFAYIAYENKAKALGSRVGLYPKVADLIEKDFNNIWFNKPEIRSLNSYYLDKVKNGASPFKAEISMFIHNNSNIVHDYELEISKLSEISKKSLSGVITTNYDLFFENIFDSYITYVGQEELIFSVIQGVAEVYKIHGSIENPDSIIINEDDYILFDEKSSYLASKLMTIFMEYPILFLGYSITDTNIQKILKSIMVCLSESNLELLKDRFIFIEYKEGVKGITIAPYSIVIDDKILEMTKVTLDNFSLLYDALSARKAPLPVKLLRRFKQELYDYTLTNIATANLRVASIDDTRIEDEELVMAIGRVSDFGLKGLKGLTSNEWYRNIIMDDLEFLADDLLEYAYPSLIKQNSSKLPLNKLLKFSKKEYLECEKIAQKNDFNEIISKSIKNNRKILGSYTSIYNIWKNEKNLEKATRLIAHLDEDQIDINELEVILKEIFVLNPKILENGKSGERTNVRRLILIYDLLKYK